MTDLEQTIATILMILLILAFVAGFLFMGMISITTNYSKKKTAFANNSGCKKALHQQAIRNWTDYFWSNKDRFLWISIFLLFFVLLGVSIGTYFSMLFSVSMAVISGFFLIFAYKSYKSFPEKATAKLKRFEATIDDAIKSEISFEGDNIQHFSDTDDEFDTEPQIFSFPVEVTKISYPPFETRAPKQTIIATRKLEFLVLSREYFSICKSATKFDLLNPARAGAPKKCTELPGATGECHEYYYSQMRNVQYDDQNQCIRIIYRDHEDDVSFSCKKFAPNRKPAMKALKEKLRLTERQKLRKIEEHRHYEELKSKRLELEENKDKIEE
jgi:uncharacterized membrane protein YciS (DUF1049 family)